MKKFYVWLAVVASVLLFSNKVWGQYCNTATTNVAITPTTSWQSTTTYNSGRRAFSFTPVIGRLYEFSSCASTQTDTYLRLYSTNTAGSVEVSNDDNGYYCTSSGRASIPWVYSTTTSRSILLTRYSCNALNANAYIDYRSPGYAPPYSGSISTTISGTEKFYDIGGPDADYWWNNVDGTITFSPSASCERIKVDFTSFETESGYDYLYIYDGNSTSAPLIGTYHGTTSPGTIMSTASDGSLTFRFTSDGNTDKPGWVADIYPVDIKPTSPNAGADVLICNGASTNLNGSAIPPIIPLTGSISFSYSGSGYDTDPVSIGGTLSGAPADATITSISFDASIGSNCDGWYEWDLYVNSTYEGSGCNGTYTYSGLNGELVNGQNLILESYDTDEYFDFFGCLCWVPNPDAISMTFDVTVNYAYMGSAPISYSWSPTTGLSNPNIANPVASPTSTTTYTMTATSNGCSVSDNVVVKVNDPNNITTTTGATGTCESNSVNDWVHLWDANGNIIASVHDHNQNMGNVTVTVPSVGNASPSAVCSGGNNAYLGRYFRFSSTTPGWSNATVRLYFTDAELTSLVNEAGCGDPNGCADDDDVCGIGDIVGTKYATGTSPGSSGGIFLSQATNGTGFGGNYVDFNVSGFSDIYLHGSEHNVPLPVELLSFEAKAIDNSYIQLDWVTATEINNEGFEVQRSTDGIHFGQIGWSNGHGNSNEIHDYVYQDHYVASNVTYYYRLKQIDYDGQFEYSSIKSAKVIKYLDAQQYMRIYPNPTEDILNIESFYRITDVKVYSILGTEVFVQKALSPRASQLDMSDLSSGMYIVTITSSESRTISYQVVRK
ncbi:T9SS type A sorting domain-containing protein [Candidatus Nomurabacteria bacterium]|nr:T9SS type A sorting domain-containing protein [Candidatus Nomurabacteria bacterium]